MEDNLRAMKKEHGHRFSCHVMLTRHNMKSGSTVVSGRGAGRLGMDEVNNVNIFPSPNNGDRSEVHAIVCGTDGFLETVCGQHVRVAIPQRVKKKKLQGPLSGLLKEAGWTKEQVSKL
jgi:hypothetical protein